MRTISDGDQVTVQNSSSHYVRLLRDGRVVLIERNQPVKDVYFSGAIGPDDVVGKPHAITLTDAENGMRITRSFTLSLSNAAFRAIVGVSSPVAPWRCSIGPDLTMVRSNLDGTGATTVPWSLAVVFPDVWRPCLGGTQKYEMVGAVTTAFGAGCPGYIDVLVGGGFRSGDDYYGCPEMEVLGW